jgi:DamX protein
MLPDYCQRFGLDADPFATEAFYITPTLEQLAEQITHASQFSAGFVVVYGDGGVGKSAFAHYFSQRLLAIQETVMLDAASTQSSRELLLKLADFLALPVSSESSVGELLAQLRTIVNNGDATLAVTVILDNAHLLPDDTLAALVSLLQVPAGRHRPFSFVLFSHRDIVARLDQYEMPDVAVQDIHFPVMSQTEQIAMLNDRMELAGYLGEPLFNESHLKDLAGQGNLGQLMIAASQFLEQASAEPAQSPPSPDKKAPLPVVHIAAVAGLLAALGLVYLYQDDASEETQVVKRLTVPAVVSAKRPGVNNSGVSSSHSAVKNASPVVAAAPSAPEPELAEPTVAPVAVQSSAASEAEPASSVAPTASSFLAASKVASAKPLRPAASGYQNDEEEVLSWPANAYTLQVLGVSDRAAARRYLARQKNRAQLRIMQTERFDKPWFIVLAGRYDSFAKAKQAAATLPKQQIKAGPWPRKVSELQAELGQ